MDFFHYFAFVILLHAVVGTTFSHDQTDGYIPDEKWGYVTVRPKAHMFWWAYGSHGTRENMPLILWLQGGPGGSGVGFGNFGEIGPVDMDLKPRKLTWLTKSNLLFVDNPVGSGFSYVDDYSALTTNITGINEDLLTLLKEVFVKIPAFRKTPFYIFSESYGGKMAAEFGNRLYQAIQHHEIECNFKGVGLGDAWISGEDSTLSWGPYLYQLGLLDEKDLAAVNRAAERASRAVKAGQWRSATEAWRRAEGVIWQTTNKVSFYNVLEPTHPYFFTADMDPAMEGVDDGAFQRHVGVYHSPDLARVMDGPIRNKLKVIPRHVRWGYQTRYVFRAQEGDFMKPVIKTVSKLISYGVKVVVFQGQLDLICDTPGAESWIRKIQWSNLDRYLATSRRPLFVNGDYSKAEGFVKEYENFALYYILRAGHMVPYDNAGMALEMVDRILKS